MKEKNEMSDFRLIEELKVEDCNFDFHGMKIHFFENCSFLLYSALKEEESQNVASNYLSFIFDLLISFSFVLLTKIGQIKTCREKKVMFFAYTGNQAKNLLPVYENLSKTEDSCFIPRQTSIHNKLNTIFFRKKSNIYNELDLGHLKYDFVQKYATLSSVKTAFQFIMWAFVSKRKITKHIKYLSQRYNCPGKENYIFNLLVSSYLHNLFILSLSRNYMLKKNIKLIVLSNEFTMPGNLLIMLAKSLNIKTLYIPHSIITGHPAYEQIHSDKVVLQGQHDYDLLKYEYNVPADKLVVTGRPFIEQRLIKYSKGKKNIDTKIICLATQPLSVKIKFVKDIIDELRKVNNSNIKIVIKPHPSEKPTDYEHLETINVEVSKENDLFEVLSTSDLVMTINSNAAAEAAFLGLPALSYNPWQLHKPIYVKKGIIEEIVNKEDILIKVEEMLFNRAAINNYEKRAEEYTYYMNHKIDGKSNERIVSVIKSLISE